VENQYVILNLPKDLGDCLLSLPAIKRVMRYCAENGLTLTATGSARAAEWVQTMGDIKLDIRDAKDLPAEARALINMNFYDETIHNSFPGIPFYEPEKMTVVEKDTPQFGAGAVIGKKHISALLEDCLKDAGMMTANEKLPMPALPASFTDEAFIKTTQEKFTSGTDYAVLIPVCAANRPLKRWQKEKFIEVAKTLMARGIKPVLLGGPSDDEKNLCSEIAAVAGGMSICGQTSLAEIAALAKGARFTLGCDTGPTHIAAQSGGQVFAFFGYYNDPATWQPRTPNNTAHVISADRIQNITVKDVLAKVLPAQAAPARVLKQRLA
jgi:hypothetical protein